MDRNPIRSKGTNRRLLQGRLPPTVKHVVKPRSSLKEYMPVGRGAYALQSAYVVRNQIRAGRHESMDKSADMHGYRGVHGEYHSSFQKITEEFGYYDLFLVDASNGRLVYTVKKEVDFGTSLYVGPTGQADWREW